MTLSVKANQGKLAEIGQQRALMGGAGSQPMRVVPAPGGVK